MNIRDKNRMKNRHRFYQRCQESKETFHHFLKDVQLLAKPCGFDNQEESLIRDRIVFGGNSAELREAFLKNDGDPTLEETIRVCMEFEKRNVNLDPLEVNLEGGDEGKTMGQLERKYSSILLTILIPSPI